MGTGGHLICFVLSFLTGGFFIPVWILLAVCGGSSKRKKALDLQRQNNELLAKLVEQQKQQNIWRGYRD